MGPLPTEPGWYNDPEGRYSHQAYWDGEAWTGATRERPEYANRLIPLLVLVLVLGLGAVFLFYMVFTFMR